ncbi:transcription initiation factor IIF, beta subunit [Cyathus striatus]|nr:transcription initiation factor IIF, beta subunit [Cyathus striatus]
MDVVDDEKKPFDAENQNNDEDTQPDPDEQLMLDQGNGRVWLVKIPKFLMARWSAINVEDAHLATLRVYNDPAKPNTKPRIILFLPPNRDPAASTPPPPDPNRPHFDAYTTYENSTEPDTYELEMVNDAVENQIVVAERPKDASLSVSTSTAAQTPNSRARTTILTGRIKHECNLRPSFSENYRRQMRERHKKYNTPTRTIRMIEDAGISGGRGAVNRLSSGVGVGAGGAFSDLIRTKAKPTKGNFERMARMPRNQLLDHLFNIFRESPRWSIKTLREKTQQPEAYLKEVLGEISFLHRAGEWNGMWELKESFKDVDNVKAEHVPAPEGHEVKMEDDNYDDDEEDEDMEEVS